VIGREDAATEVPGLIHQIRVAPEKPDFKELSTGQ
jgi:hypothetical protein